MNTQLCISSLTVLNCHTDLFLKKKHAHALSIRNGIWNFEQLKSNYKKKKSIKIQVINVNSKLKGTKWKSLINLGGRGENENRIGVPRRSKNRAVRNFAGAANEKRALWNWFSWGRKEEKEKERGSEERGGFRGEGVLVSGLYELKMDVGVGLLSYQCGSRL